MKIVFYNTEGKNDATVLETEHAWLAEQGLAEKYHLVRLDGEQDEAFLREAEDADAVVLIYFQANRAALTRLKQCKVLATQTIGLNQVDLQAASELNIEVCNTPDYCVEEVAEHTVALWLSCVRRVAEYDRTVRAGRWEVEACGPMHRLTGKTYGFVSFGRIAQRVAQLLRGFPVTCMAYDPFAPDAIFEKAGVVRARSLEELFAASNFVSIHTPLTAQTRHMIGEELLKKMQPGSVLLSVGRGGVLEEQALANALQSGTVAAAGLDVLEEEPEINPALVKFPQVVFTPHVAYNSEESIRDVRVQALQKVVKVLERL